MKQSKQSSSVAASTRKTPLALSIVFACLLATNSPAAMASDVPAFGQRVAAQIQQVIDQAASIYEEVKQYENQIKDIKNQIPDPSKLFNAAGSVDPYDIATAQKRPLSYRMNERCDQGSSSGFSFNPKELLAGLFPSSGTNFVQKQKEICARIVTLENAKYNVLIDRLKEINDMTEEREKVREEAGKNDKPGQADNSKIAMTELSVKAAALHARMHTEATLFDSMIETLNQEMKDEAKQALDGKPKNFAESLLSTGVSLVTLKATLSGLKSSCPSGFDCD
jgi:hypothetical protein